jgi:tRNA(Ile)-lysidine synthase
VARFRFETRNSKIGTRLPLAVPRTPQNSLQQRVCHYIREQDMVHAGDRVGIAVSGGADSVALLRLLHELQAELGFVVAAVHVNHGLRGQPSDADEGFVAELARRLNLEVHILRVDVQRHATEHNVSLEAAGRELRHRCFAEVASAQRLDCVATGHTLDDQAETVLLKLTRGAWTRGLAGIYPTVTTGREFRIVRPLLHVRRAELRAYLEALRQPWREDATNLDVGFTRNRIRHDLLPLIESKYNAGIAEVLAGTAEIARGEQEYWDQAVPGLLADCFQALPCSGPDRRYRFDRRRFRNLHVAAQRRLIAALLSQVSVVDFEHVELLREALLGNIQSASLPGGVDFTWGAGGKEVVLKQRLTPPEPER